MPTFWHVSIESCASSIRQHGLIPSIGSLSEQAGESKPLIYLFGDKVSMEDAVGNWLGDVLEAVYGEDIELICCKVQVSETMVQKHIKKQGFEYVCDAVIPSTYIEILDL